MVARGSRPPTLDIRNLATGIHRRRYTRVSPRIGTLVGVLGVLAALALPLAPVVTQDTTVTWPEAGRAPRSTLAFVVPYMPAEVHIRVPCPVVEAARAMDRPTAIVSSSLPGRPTKGFTVTTEHNEIIVVLAGREAMRTPVTSTRCAVAADSDSAGSTVRIGDQVAALPGARVKNIIAFATELDPAHASGLQATVKTANWFENTPTLLKSVLIVTQLLLAAIALVLLVREDKHRRSLSDHASTPAPQSSHRVIDLLVCGALGVWAVLGPNTPDDGFAATTVRNGLRIGDIGNYYRWENASEAPFTLVQHLLEPLVALTDNPLALRVPSVLAGLLTWLVVSRAVLGAVLPEHGHLATVRGLTALGFLGWWLPFDLGVRPESFAALGVTAVLALLLRSTADPGGGLATLGVAALGAGLTMAINPVGLIALAPPIVLSPGIRRVLRGPKGCRRGALPNAALVACLASTGLVAMFATQSLSGVREATRLHRYYGPDVPWFREIERYQFLLGFGLQGDVGRRTPILCGLALLIFVAFLFTRGARRLPGMRMAHIPPACLAAGLALLWLTPSKWTHYFGALAGVGAVTLAAGAVVSATAARQWAEDSSVVLLALQGSGLVVAAAALSFAGKNNWFLHSQYGAPWDDGPVRPLDSPVPWLFLAITLVAGSTVGEFARVTGRGMLIRMPAVVGAVAVGVSVSILLWSFVVAPVRQAGSYSVGKQNLGTLTGHGCGIGDDVVVTPDLPAGVLSPAEGADRLDGFQRNAGYQAEYPPPGVGSAFLWGSRVPGAGTGRLTSRWFALPTVQPSQEIAISVAGRTGDGNRLALEFGSAAGGGVRPLGERVLNDAYREPDHRPIYPADHVVHVLPQDHPAWRSLRVDARDVPDGADRVRIRAVDATADRAGWLAVTGPRTRPVIRLTTYLRGRAPVLVDWSMAWSLPCVRAMPLVGHGLAQPPAFLVNPPDRLGFDGSAAYLRAVGGTFAAVGETGRVEEIPTRLLGSDNKPEYADWGHLLTVRYPMPSHGYDVRTVGVPRWGWQGKE